MASKHSRQQLWLYHIRKSTRYDNIFDLGSHDKRRRFIENISLGAHSGNSDYDTFIYFNR